MSFKTYHYLVQPVRRVLVGKSRVKYPLSQSVGHEVEKQPVSLSAILSVRHKERQMVSQYLIHLIRYMVRQPGRQMDGQSVSLTRKRIDKTFCCHLLVRYNRYLVDRQIDK